MEIKNKEDLIDFINQQENFNRIDVEISSPVPRRNETVPSNHPSWGAVIIKEEKTIQITLTTTEDIIYFQSKNLPRTVLI